MPRKFGQKKKNDNPPILSHDFVIINHGDIFATLLLLVFAGSISQFNISSLCNTLLFLNNEANTTNPREFFTKSSFDYVQSLFYVTVMIVVHCIYQEYFIDKVIKKLKNSTPQKRQSTNEAFLLFLWHAFNASWVASIMFSKSSSNSSFSEAFNFSGYPHDKLLPYSVKFFFILQLSHWLHTLPELYLSRATKHQYKPAFKSCFIYCTLFCISYELYLWKLTLVLTLFDSLPKSFFHLARLFKYYEAPEPAQFLFKIWTILGAVAPILSTAVLAQNFIINNSVTGEVFRFTREVAIVVGVLLQAYQLALYSQSFKKHKVQEREALKALREKQKQYKKKQGPKTEGFHSKKRN